jgi:hypothetical protein
MECQCYNNKTGKRCTFKAKSGTPYCGHHAQCAKPFPITQPIVPLSTPEQPKPASTNATIPAILTNVPTSSAQAPVKKILKRIDPSTTATAAVTTTATTAAVTTPLTQTWLDKPIEEYTEDATGKYVSGGEEYILPNHRQFPTWITTKFIKYKIDKDIVNKCGDDDATGVKKDKPLFSHQMFIRDYMAPNMPYRGILLYHDLGSGKTRTAITVSEQYRAASPGVKILVLLPATLRPTWFEELKNWGGPDLRRPPNYEQLSENDQIVVNLRLDNIINNGYTFISYNESKTADKIAKFNNDNKLSHRLVIVDEVHGLISMIVSPSSKKGKRIYDQLMDVTDCKFLFLSATPLLNSAFELGRMFNILKGYITKNGAKHTLFPSEREDFENMYIDPNANKVIKSDRFKRNILGMVSYYFGGEGEIYPTVLPPQLVECEFGDYQFKIYSDARLEEIERDRMKSMDDPNLKKTENKTQESINSTFRIYSRLYSNFVFPPYIKRPIAHDFKHLFNMNLDNEPNLWTPVQIAQLVELYDGRQEGIETFKNKYRKITSDTARMVFIKRTVKELGKNFKGFAKVINSEEAFTGKAKVPDKYKKALDDAFALIRKDKQALTTDLNTYSPKFDALRRIIMNEQPQGCCFVYSFFSILEGINILTAVLEQNGFEELNYSAINKHASPGAKDYIGNFVNAITPDKPGRFVIYTGGESMEDRTKIRWIFNHKTNMRGEVCKVFLGTSAAAEGISLKNVRQVHIMEPHWNNVRIQQVIGRARRICSHYTLPKDERNFKVYNYHMKLTSKQQDTMGEDDSTDQAIYHIAENKEKINLQFLQILKDSAVDCSLNLAHNRTEKNPINCFSFGMGEKTVDSFIPDMTTTKKTEMDTTILYKQATIPLKEFTSVTYKGPKVHYKVDAHNVPLKESIKITAPGKLLGKMYDALVCYQLVGSQLIKEFAIVGIDATHGTKIQGNLFELV